MLNVFAAIAVTAVLVGVTATSHAQNAAPPACVASPAPANLGFTLKDLNGKDVRLSAYQGKVLVVNFWATWCAPCKVEIPGFKDLYSRYRRRGLEVIGIAVDEPPSTVAPYARDMRMNYPVLIGQHRQDVLDAFGPIVGLPTTIVVNRDGTICQRYPGFTRKQTFEDIVKRLL